MPRSRGGEDYRATDLILAQLNELVRQDPTDLGYLRSRWSSELLALELSRQGWAEVHATTVRRWLARLCIVWRRRAVRSEGVLQSLSGVRRVNLARWH